MILSMLSVYVVQCSTVAQDAFELLLKVFSLFLRIFVSSQPSRLLKTVNAIHNESRMLALIGFYLENR